VGLGRIRPTRINSRQARRNGAAKRGSVDAVIRNDVATSGDVERVQVVLNLEAVGRANGDARAREYRLRAVGVGHGERPG
jgi:hypothetical protein